MAVSPTTNEQFVREVDEELRREQALTVWKRYGRWIVAAVVGALALLAAFLWWQSDRAAKLGLEGERLSTALDDLGAGKRDAIAPTMQTLAGSKSQGVSVAARLTNAAILLDRRDVKAAAAAYGAIAADAALEQPYRDLALVRQTAVEFDTMTPDAVIARLKPLAAPGNPWFGSAGEMVGIAYIRQGKNDLAAATFAAIAKDETVPETIRSRVVQLAGLSGADAIPAKGTN